MHKKFQSNGILQWYHWFAQKHNTSYLWQSAYWLLPHSARLFMQILITHLVSSKAINNKCCQFQREPWFQFCSITAKCEYFAQTCTVFPSPISSAKIPFNLLLYSDSIHCNPTCNIKKLNIWIGVGARKIDRNWKSVWICYTHKLVVS